MGGVRRIVTGHAADGASTIAEDGPSPHRHVRKATGLVVTNIWRTTAAPASASPEDDGLAGPSGVAPPPCGTVFRIVEFPPDSEWVGRVSIDELRRSYDPGEAGAFTGQGGRPDMHRTDSVDYVIVLEGELVAVLERSEAAMGPGDVLVQCGTVHAWSNRTDRPCKAAFVLVDATPPGSAL